jgi:hypothetical protein
MPIEGTLSKLAELKDLDQKKEVPQVENSEDQTFLTQQDASSDPQDKLDQMELTDYLKNKG